MESTEAKHLIRLEVGDYWEDGHGKSESIIIECNISRRYLEEAYKKGSELTGISLDKECSDYELNELSLETRSLLEVAGIDIDIDEDGIINSQTYSYIYMSIAKAGNPNLEYRFVEMDRIPIGGYGLFFC